MTKRQRFVYPTDEVPHLWAHKTQSEATNPRRNLYFTGDTIFSYGEHFPIARHVTGGTKRKPLAGVLFTSRSYSSTTAKHKGKVRQSIPSNVMAFEVPNVNVWDGHSANLQYFSNEAKRLLAKAQNGRKYGAYSWKEAQKNVANAKAYATFFRITFPTKLFKFMPKGEALTALEAKIAERTARAKALDAEYAAKAAIARAERQRIAALEMPENIALWRTGGNMSWGYSTDVPTLLRIKGDEVETSHGARVPLRAALRALRLVQAVVASGREYVRNGHTVHIGHYAVDRVTVDGTLTAGCHVIPFAEIELLTPQLEALVSGLPPEQEETATA